MTGTDPAQEAAIGSKGKRLIYRLVGTSAVALAGLGVVLPGLPTTPFLLIAGWAFARSSPRLHQALLDDRRFGPLLKAWDEHGAIPRSGKVAAVVGMAISWVVIVLVSRHWAGPTIVGLVMLCSGTFVLTRPSPPTLPAKESVS